MRTTCRNPRCYEHLSVEDQANAHPLAPAGFCPSCRFAIWLGVKAGWALAFLGGGAVTLLAWLARH